MTTVSRVASGANTFECKLPSRKVIIACKPESFARGDRRPIDVTGPVATDMLARYHANAADITQAAEEHAPDFEAHMTVFKGSIPLEPHDNRAAWDFRINAVA